MTEEEKINKRLDVNYQKITKAQQEYDKLRRQIMLDHLRLNELYKLKGYGR